MAVGDIYESLGESLIKEMDTLAKNLMPAEGDNAGMVNFMLGRNATGQVFHEGRDIPRDPIEAASIVQDEIDSSFARPERVGTPEFKLASVMTAYALRRRI